MAEKEQSSGSAISSAIRAERQSGVTTDRSILSQTLVKSPQWKKNALQRIETVRSSDPADGTPAMTHTLKQSLLELVERHWQELVANAASKTHERLKRQSSTPADDSDDTALRETCMQQESKSMREASALHAEEVKGAKRRLRKQSATLQRRSEEIERLRQTIARLKAENAGLIAKHKHELDAKRAELLGFQEAYDQFEHQSDLLLIEIDQQNECLRVESRHQNRRSML